MTGVVRVDSIELDSLSSAWNQLAVALEEWAASWRTWDAEFAPEASGREATSIAVNVRELAERLDRVTQAYHDVETSNTLVFQRASDACLWLVGRLLPTLGCVLGPVAASFAASLAFSRVLLDALPPRLRSHLVHFQTDEWAHVLSSPAVVRAIEVGVGSLDEGISGALGLPLPVALGIGSAGLGITSLAGTSRLASRVNGIAARPSAAVDASTGGGVAVPTTVERVGTQPVRAPRDIADALSRIPSSTDDGAQVRIEKFGDTHVVYIGGTVDASLGVTSQPWDMSSNLAALGGDPGASENAVRRAMEQSGIGRGDPVILVGHSQGGLVAMRVAQSPDVTARAVITAGAPIHALTPPPEVPIVAFEHIDDVVPALGGTVTQPQQGVVYVRSLGTTPSSFTGDSLVPAHRLEAYVQTARECTKLDDARVTQTDAALGALTGSGTTTLWKATRSEVEK